MYSLTQKLTQVAGIGPATADKLAAKDLYTIQDLLLWVPLRYEDRSQQKLIKNLIKNELITICAEVVSVSNRYQGQRSIQRATVRDKSGSLNMIWFNSPYIKDTLQVSHSYFFSGRLNDRNQMAQAKVEKISDNTVHTNRLVPVYSQIPGIKQGNIRRFLKEITDHLQPIEDLLANQFDLLPLGGTFKHLHFPDDQQLTIKSRKRLALEELLGLMQRSQQLKRWWQQDASAHLIKIDEQKLIPHNLPFELTNAQRRSVHEVLFNLKSNTPMNRLLLGDVGSGKTVVAGIAALHTLQAKHHVALVAPTQILAKQHWSTLKQLFPEINIQLLTAKTKFQPHQKPTLYLGTHAVINHLSDIKPALVIYDEQHRFGVKQRSQISDLALHPHILTMSATPIPRSLMLAIFSHLELSVIDELPAGRQPVKTWLVPEKKRSAAYDWIKQQLAESATNSVKQRGQVLVVCPFINPSEAEALENVTSATASFDHLQAEFSTLRVELLHGQLSQTQKDQIIRDLFDQKINLLVTTPIVEVGVDLPAANIMLIESAQRFGLASLHQLRGRVGRADQQAYCLLFAGTASPDVKKRLQIFAGTNDGMKLAEFDLQNRGAGDLFGIDQHGFDQLQFASWTNVKLISQARQIFDRVKDTDYQSLMTPLYQDQSILAN